jgi:hypothetical protein
MLCRQRGETPNPGEFKKKEAALAEKLNVYEKILSKQKYLAGDVSIYDSHHHTTQETESSVGIHACRFVSYRICECTERVRLGCND